MPLVAFDRLTQPSVRRVGCCLLSTLIGIPWVMTLHKLNITFQQESYSLVDTVVNSRALQALEVATTNHPIHRTLRCAARGKLERLFDDLALKAGLIAQRLEE